MIGLMMMLAAVDAAVPEFMTGNDLSRMCQATELERSFCIGYVAGVSDAGARAAEHGVWTALKQGTRYGGDYLAHWARTPDGWRVRGEVYVKLYCSGALCTP